MPAERVGVAIGPEGAAKREIEDRTGTRLVFDSEACSVKVESGPDPVGVLKAEAALKAIARGFSAKRAFRLLDEDQYLEVIDITDFAGDSDKAVSRLKGRVIGEDGKTRETIERLTETYVSVYGKTVAAIGTAEQLPAVREALVMLLSGREHSTVYRFLEKKRRDSKNRVVPGF
jgi:ribosomal RNA assembly protein